MATRDDLIFSYNAAARKWGKATVKKLQVRLATLGLHDQLRAGGRRSLIQSLKSVAKSRDGQVENIQFRFLLHGWFVEKGVGRGIPLDQVAGSSRKPKPWLFLIDQQLGDLGDQVAEVMGDDFIRSIKSVN